MCVQLRRIMDNIQKDQEAQVPFLKSQEQKNHGMY